VVSHRSITEKEERLITPTYTAAGEHNGREMTVIETELLHPLPLYRQKGKKYTESDEIYFNMIVGKRSKIKLNLLLHPVPLMYSKSLSHVHS
jgi:hypothetical protein